MNGCWYPRTPSTLRTFSFTIDRVQGQLWSPSAFFGSTDKVAPLTISPRHLIFDTLNSHLAGCRKYEFSWKMSSNSPTICWWRWQSPLVATTMSSMYFLVSSGYLFSQCCNIFCIALQNVAGELVSLKYMTVGL